MVEIKEIKDDVKYINCEYLFDKDIFGNSIDKKNSLNFDCELWKEGDIDTLQKEVKVNDINIKKIDNITMFNEGFSIVLLDALDCRLIDNKQLEIIQLRCQDKEKWEKDIEISKGGGF